MAVTLPHGSWPSPLRAADLVAQAVAVGEVRVGTDDVWWSELRPAEGGRVAVVRHRPGGQREDVLPEGSSARSRVHEYGGGAWWLHDDALFWVEAADQRVWRLDAGSPPVALTPEPTAPGADRHADGRVTTDGRWVVCVRERHHPGQGHQEPSNEIVGFRAHLDGRDVVEPVVLVAGRDFVAAPRPSPDGRHLCWLAWDHPDMPWDGTELWVADLVEGPDGIALADARRVAGGPGQSVTQPTWTPAGDLLCTTDASGWWGLARLGAAAVEASAGGGTGPAPTPLAPVAGEVGVPAWVFDQSRYAVLADGRILCAVAQGGLDRLAVVAGDGALSFVACPYTALSSLAAFGGGAVLVGGSPTREPEVVVLEVPAAGDPAFAALRPARDLGLDQGWCATPEPISFPATPVTVDGPDGPVTIDQAHALLYRPTNPEATAPAGELPPLVVICHGGPTSAARPQLNLTTQYWTTRGIAVVDVNYRGSTGYGRPYRRALDGRWGELDVDDCVAAARHLVEAGVVDGGRLAIRGSSAGGLTTLAALTGTDAFAAGSSLYGIADLEALARDTHKFEARYTDTLVGPYPEARDLYRARSPLHHADQLSCPVIVFQGTEDAVVPPAQAEVLVAALRAKGLPHAYLLFEGEGHGFRRAGTMERVLEAELSFLAQVLGFELAGDIEPVAIERA